MEEQGRKKESAERKRGWVKRACKQQKKKKHKKRQQRAEGGGKQHKREYERRGSNADSDEQMSTKGRKAEANTKHDRKTKRKTRTQGEREPNQARKRDDLDPSVGPLTVFLPLLPHRVFLYFV